MQNENLNIKRIFADSELYIDKRIEISGWVRNHRRQKAQGFMDFFDGSCFESLQIGDGEEISDIEAVRAIRNGSAVKAGGTLVRAPRGIEIRADRIELLGDCEEAYPLQPKKHSLEFLREIAHLRPRTRLFQAVMRVRSTAAMAVHEYFQSNGYLYVHTPIITAADAEGAGNTFTVTTLNPLSQNESFSDDFFGRHTSLAVSGQLEGETYAMAFGKIYTFGPTFRAENSNTKTHAAEFWMIEPEIAFCDLHGVMDIEEEFLKSVVKYVMEKCESELDFLQKFHGTKLKEKLNALLNSRPARVTHREAIDILKKSGVNFSFKPEYGEDLAREHEKYLTEVHFNSPVFVYDWPKDIKAFYMYQNDDGETVAAVDLLVPGSGELMGGSQRETRLDKLTSRMDELGIDKTSLSWYIDLRRYGCPAHSGFGMGFERLIMYLTDVENIRDVLPYYRTPQNCDF